MSSFIFKILRSLVSEQTDEWTSRNHHASCWSGADKKKFWCLNFSVQYIDVKDSGTAVVKNTSTFHTPINVDKHKTLLLWTSTETWQGGCCNHHSVHRDI